MCVWGMGIVMSWAFWFPGVRMWRLERKVSWGGLKRKELERIAFGALDILCGRWTNEVRGKCATRVGFLRDSACEAVIP